ncbi:hypothetical protein M3689_01090 [Alkalihalophilus marmarensis]|jgi:hypothetical protein|uniref:hypothetical protein n=1 Tax=Alkalihalophilus marmarensis TaxID=521377 RepID=UPI00203EA4EE|nr:hypothetical protein [Alkalihalophilus marmarensis]MCM3487894.1 hypothetical protein [Alkalihalophilus marmarensis]
MSVKIRNMDKVTKQLEQRLGKKGMEPVIDKALLKGAVVIARGLAREFEGFKDTGNSIKEITISDPFYLNGSRTIKIHWTGPDGRYRIIHLNEWGTINNPNPRGKGAVARTLNQGKAEYRKALVAEIRSRFK